MSYVTPPGYSSLGLGIPVSAEQQLRTQVQKYEQAFAELRREPLALLTVIAITGEGRGVIAGAPPIELSVPAGTKVGSQLRCLPKEKNGFEVLPEPVSFGPIVKVLELHGTHVVVKAMAGEALVAVADGLSLEPGDRVALDPSALVALRKVSGPDGAASVAAAQSVSWDDIGGQEEAKEALREAIEYPTRFADIYKAHGQKPAKGALLHGPPGTGKTLLAKALATSIAGDTGGFIYVKATEVMTKWQGESGATVRALFRQGRDYQARTGKRAVLFIDEADALLPVRDGGGVAVGSGLEDMVPVFLTEMDGLDQLGPFVLLATNRPDRIDPAVLRDGRCETKVFVARPNRESCEAIFRLALRGRALPTEAMQWGLAKEATERLFSDRLILLELTYPGVRTSEYLRLRDLVSGAMIEGIVQRAAGLAIKRDRERGFVSPLQPEDVEAAIKVTLRQQARVNHDAVIADISRAFGKHPERVRKVIDG